MQLIEESKKLKLNASESRNRTFLLSRFAIKMGKHTVPKKNSLTVQWRGLAYHRITENNGSFKV
jgi:hypothetical protein